MALQSTSITVTAFERFLAQPENRKRAFELINGEIAEKVVTQQHGIIAVNVAAAIKRYLREHPVGRVAVETRYRPEHEEGNENNDRLPDVSFVSGLEKAVVEVGPVPYLPDLAVEIKSPDDTYKMMRDTSRFYLAHGTRLVWLIFPEKAIVECYSVDWEEVLTEADTLTGRDVLPDFSMTVREIFDL